MTKIISEITQGEDSLLDVSDENLNALRVAVLTEQERRATLEDAQAQQDALTEQVRQARFSGLPDDGEDAPEVWTEPVPGQMFDWPMIGDVRRHPDADGQDYESTINYNWLEPGSGEGWSLIDAAGGDIAPWEQPGSTNPYMAGAVVTHNGQTWDNTHGDGNVWEPGVYGWTVRP